ncbi:MAG: flippase-like domain-containing protein [Candidatus Kapabacteria bacterium]|nr:flippase-like domain-containing protein [Candidatus Kapabacteria bacterium]
MTARSIVRIGIATIVLVLGLWWTLHAVDLGNMLRIMMASDALLVTLCVPIILLSHVVRAHRWNILLRPSAPDVPLTSATSAVLIGYAANSIVPRSGELIRPWVLSRRCSIPLGTSIASIVVERILDVLSLVTGIAVVSLIANDRISTAIPTLTFERVLTVIVLPMTAVAAAIGVVAYTRVGAWTIERLVRPLRASAADALHRILDTVRSGLHAVAQPRLYAGLLTDTVLIWLMWALPLMLCYHAIPHDHAVSFGMADATIVLLIVSIGATIAPTPGAIGVYQSFAQLALMVLYGAGQDEATAFAMLTWIVNYMLTLVVGGCCWLYEVRQGLTWRDLVESARKP